MLGLVVPLLMAATTAGVGARPLDPGALARIGDLAENTLPSAHEGDVFANLSIDFLGVPIRCAVARSSGFPGMDARTCTALMRLRFQPARDEAGVPIASVYPVSVRWSVGDRRSPGYLLDETVEVGKLPAGAGQALVAVRQIVAADGALESCEVESPSGMPGLDRLACKQAEGLAKLGAITDRSGKPVRTLRVSRIQFVEKGHGS